MRETDSTSTETDSSGETERKPKSKGGRNYVRKGAGNGGRRPGSGRPPGVSEYLPRGTVAVINAGRVAEKRLGPDAHPEDLATVQRVYERVAEVLEGRVHFTQASSVLKAGAMVADAVAGPIPSKAELTGSNGGALEILITDLSASDE